MKQIQADVLVIGGGTAGMGAFRHARQFTDKVYLVESTVFGTTCARVGCMPSKLLIAAAEARHHALHTAPFGIHLDTASVRTDGREVMARVKAERDRFVGFVLEDVEAWPAERRIMGEAKFIDEHTVEVGGHTRISAERIVIATGSRPLILPQWQSLGDRLIVNDDVFSWDDLPESVAVFGPGVIGLELGQALSRLGVKVEIFGVSGNLAGLADPVIRREAVASFSQELTLHLDSRTQVSLDENGKVVVDWEENGQSGRFVADYALAAAGRIGEAEIAEEYAKDSTSYGQIFSAQARGALPDPAVRDKVWREITGDFESNTVQRNLALGLRRATPESLVPYAVRYYEDARAQWDNHSVEIARNMLEYAFPIVLAGRTDLGVDIVALGEKWLKDNKDAAPACVRLVSESVDSAQRAVRAQAVDAGK